MHQALVGTSGSAGQLGFSMGDLGTAAVQIFEQRLRTSRKKGHLTVRSGESECMLGDPQP